MAENYVTDTSVLIEKIVSKLIKRKEIKGKILVPKAVIAELENQANRGQEIGFLGLEELQEIKKLEDHETQIEFIGQRPTEAQIKLAKSGEIDALIREIAQSENAMLLTADYVQAESAKASGVKVRFFRVKITKKRLAIEKLFDDNTMSVHLKENCCPHAKKGRPGSWSLLKIRDKRLHHKEMMDMAKEIVEYARIDPNSFVEISRRGSTIVQYKNYRVVIVKPPISDGWEITVVRPIKKLNLASYSLHETLLKRLKEKARGIIVAGETGSGKSTFAQAVAESYAQQGKVVKTVESPRDLQLMDEITQYSKNLSSSEEIHDILFLSRPDNIVFDEMRDTPDFQLYIDLRLAGSNVIGVLHSASPIDAIQRFIRRLDTGMIPSVVDTILFMEDGRISKVYLLVMLVKVPTGMTEADLARPIVEVRDFEKNKLEYEIYSYGEETVVIPIASEQATTIGAQQLASKAIENELSRYVSRVKVEVLSNNKATVYIPMKEIARIIGKKGKQIEKIERKLGIGINVEPL